MKILLAGAAFFTALASPVSAETRHDRKLEQAMMDIVAAKIGDIRGGFSYDREPEFVTVPHEITTGSAAPGTALKPASSRTAGSFARAGVQKASHIISF